MTDIDLLAKKLWDYHILNQELVESDLIFVLGSHDKRIAEYGVELFMQKLAPMMLFSGGVAHNNDLLRTGWEKTEAETFADIAMSSGVPKESILVENQAKNTGENITLGYKVLKDNNLNPKRIILVQKPYMVRRTYATFMKQWPGENVEIIVTSPNISFEEYCKNDEYKQTVINLMVGDLQRIKEYPAKGFQIPQEIPNDVWEAYEKLVGLGFDKHLIKD